MLLRTLFVALLLTTLAETAVHGADALARAALRRQALLAVHAQIATAETMALRSLADALAAGADPRDVLPTPLPVQPTCRLRFAHACAISTQARVTFEAANGPASPSPCPSDGCVAYEQNNDRVEEGRVAVRVLATAIDAAGATLAVRGARVWFRTMRVAPYANFAGGSDASVAGPGENAGDDAGIAPADNAPGTLVNVRYENALTGVEMPANAWRATLQSGETAEPAWPP